MKPTEMLPGLIALRRDGLRLILLALAALLAGILWGLFDARLRCPSPGTGVDGVVHLAEIRLADLQELDVSGWVVVDARDPMLYRMGHIPGSLNLPARTLDTMDEELLLAVIPPDLRATPVLVYCSDADCKDSGKVGERLRDAGLGRVHVLREGWKGWLEAGGKVKTP